MPKYQIKVSYTTGDSFSSEEREALLEYTWEKLEIIRENLQRIKLHYNWYINADNHRHDALMRMTPEFCVPNDSRFKPSSVYDYSILLLTDDGITAYRLYPFWTGYFERLHFAEIVIVGDNENKIWFH